MSYIEIRRTKGDTIAIYPEANFKPNGEYQHRTATEEGYQQFADYFKNIDFCCYPFEISCEEEGYTDCKVFIEYHRQTRSFWVENGHNLISHCPFCGKRFPEELTREWLDLVEKEFGEEYLSPPKMYELPEEWLTDEWWVKRGL